MGYQPFLVATLEKGLIKDAEPWVLPENAYPSMVNMFSYYGVLYSKGGNRLLGRLGSRDQNLLVRGAGNTVVNLALAWPPIEPGSIIITDGVTTFTDDGIGGFTIAGGTGVVNAPTNYAAGTINITFTTANPGATISAFYYVVVNNNSVVMGITNQEAENSLDASLIAFDLIKSYIYSDALARFVNISTYKNSGYEINWTGTDTDFFWSRNYFEALWSTNNVPGAHFYTITGITNAANAQITIGAHNFLNGDRVYIRNVQGMTQINNQIGVVTGVGALTINVNINSVAYGAYTGGGVVWSIEKTRAASGDGIRWYDEGNGWVNFAPALDDSATPNILQGCLMILPYKGRLLCLNTVEGTTYATRERFPQRVRWSQQGVPFVAQSFPVASAITTSDGEAWSETNELGGFLDAPTNEEIVSAAFVKDTLVVFFERSTWRLDFTGDPVLPFVWSKINSDLGSESTFSTVTFDKNATTVGGYAIAECDTRNMVRIDENIPEQVFDFRNAFGGTKKVHGIRDYYNRVCFWTYVESSAQQVYPNRTLVYNYNDLCWSVFKTYYTTFGYYRRSNDMTWGTALYPWSEYDINWGQESLQSLFPFVVAGNTQGFIHEIQDVDKGDYPSGNDLFYVIQNVTAGPPSVITVPNHNLEDGDHILITGVYGATSINDQIYTVRNPTNNTFEIFDSLGAPVTAIGAYTYGGNISIVDNFELITKKFNPFFSLGKKVKIGYIDLFVGNTTSGNITVEIYQNENDVDPIITKNITLVDPKSLDTQKFWYRLYVNTTLQTFSLKFKYSDGNSGQIFDLINVNQAFTLYGWILWAMPMDRLV